MKKSLGKVFQLTTQSLAFVSNKNNKTGTAGLLQNKICFLAGVYYENDKMENMSQLIV